MRAPTGAPLQWLRDHLHVDTDECILWPFGTLSGYGQIRFEGHPHKAHHVVMTLAGVRDLDAESVVRHTCNTKLCTNLRHLREGTQQENVNDRLGYSVALTVEDVHAIRASTELQRVLAERYGVSRSTISLVSRRLRWASV